MVETWVKILMLSFSLLLGLISMIMMLSGSVYKQYYKLFKAVMAKKANIETAKISLNQMITLLRDNIVCPNRKTEGELKSYLKFLESVSGWDNLSNIQINLSERNLPDWVTCYPKSKFFMLIAKGINTVATIGLVLSIYCLFL